MSKRRLSSYSPRRKDEEEEEKKKPRENEEERLARRMRELSLDAWRANFSSLLAHGMAEKEKKTWSPFSVFLAGNPLYDPRLTLPIDEFAASEPLGYVDLDSAIKTNNWQMFIRGMPLIEDWPYAEKVILMLFAEEGAPLQASREFLDRAWDELLPVALKQFDSLVHTARSFDRFHYLYNHLVYVASKAPKHSTHALEFVVQALRVLSPVMLQARYPSTRNFELLREFFLFCAYQGNRDVLLRGDSWEQTLLYAILSTYRSKLGLDGSDALELLDLAYKYGPQSGRLDDKEEVKRPYFKALLRHAAIDLTEILELAKPELKQRIIDHLRDDPVDFETMLRTRVAPNFVRPGLGIPGLEDREAVHVWTPQGLRVLYTRLLEKHKKAIYASAFSSHSLEVSGRKEVLFVADRASMERMDANLPTIEVKLPPLTSKAFVNVYYWDNEMHWDVNCMSEEQEEENEDEDYIGEPVQAIRLTQNFLLKVDAQNVLYEYHAPVIDPMTETCMLGPFGMCCDNDRAEDRIQPNHQEETEEEEGDN